MTWPSRQAQVPDMTSRVQYIVSGRVIGDPLQLQQYQFPNDGQQHGCQPNAIRAADMREKNRT